MQKTNNDQQNLKESKSMAVLAQGFHSDGGSESLNTQLCEVHIAAVEHLKSLGFTQRAIEDSMRSHSIVPGGLNI